MQTANPHIGLLLDRAQRTELLEFVRNAPDTELARWLRQYLPEHGFYTHIPSHQDDARDALIAVMAAELVDMRRRLAQLEKVPSK